MKKKNIVLIGIGAAIALGAAIFFMNKKKDQRDKPPKKAPQLDLENPGEQSEFITSASESELG